MRLERLRPMSLGDIFVEGFELYRSNFATFLLIAAWTVVVPQTAIAWLSTTYYRASDIVNDSSSLATPGRLFSWLFSLNATYWGVLLLWAIAAVLPVACLVLATVERCQDRSIAPARIVGQVLIRFPALLATVLLAALALSIGWTLCYLPGIALAAFLLFTMHVFFAERRSLFQAITRSCNLASGYWFSIMGYAVLAIMLSIVLTNGVAAPIEYALGRLVSIIPGAEHLLRVDVVAGSVMSRYAIVHAVALDVAGLFTLPFVVSVTTVYYFDLRLRKEAFDMERLADDLGYPPLSKCAPYLPAAVALMMPPVPSMPPPRRRGSRDRDKNSGWGGPPR